MATIPLSEMTLPELRAALAPRLAENAVFDGWSEAALAEAARGSGVPEDRARLAFPGGAVDMIDAWFADIDRQMTAALSPERLAAMKIRERITALVWARIETARPVREALRRALAVLAMPQNVAAGARLGWRVADIMWRLAGDEATDLAYYTKRLTLVGVYGATLLALLEDESDELSETRAFLDRRIAGVMRFEALKARLRPDPDQHFSPLRFFGRLRYPAR